MGAPLRQIVIVCESAELVGGAEQVAISEAIELSTRGYQVIFFSSGKSMCEELKSSKVRVVQCESSSFFEESSKITKVKKLIGNSVSERSFENLLSQLDVSETIIHFHTFSLKLSPGVLRVAQRLGFKTILHCHDYSSVCPTALLYDHRKGNVCTLKPLSFQCFSTECQGVEWKYKFPKYTSLLWAKNALYNLDALIHVSELERDTLLSHLSTRGQNFLLTNPIGSDFRPTVRVKAETNNTFLVVSRLTKEKGVEDFLTAVPTGIVVGDGPELQPLKAKFHNAKFIGWKTEAEVSQLLDQARALVVPSRWLETYGLNVIRALSKGIPVIASEHVGACKHIVNAVNGFTYNPQDLNRLVETIDKLGDDSTVQKLSTAAFELSAESIQTNQRHVDELVEIYEKVLTGVQAV